MAMRRSSRGRGTWRGPRHGERGLVLVLAVFAVALLLVLSVGLTTVVRGELLASSTSLQRAQSLFLAEAGINQVRALLMYEDLTSDTLQDVWGPEADDPLDAPQRLGPGYVRVRVYDACGRLDLNGADFEALTRLTGDAGLAAAITDWRGPGVDAGYYRSLAYPYAPRQGGFQTVGELLLVKGMTPDVYYGTPTGTGLRDLMTVASASLDTTSTGKPRIPLNVIATHADEPSYATGLMKQYGEALSAYDLQEIGRCYMYVQGRGGYTSLGQLMSVAGLSQRSVIRSVDLFTVNRNAMLGMWGKVNANTAPVEVLAALPGSSSALAEAFVQEREKRPFTSLGQVAQVMFANGGQHTFEQLIDFVTTKSSCFVIDAMGYTGTGRGFRRLRAFVHRTEDQVAVLHQVEEDTPLPPPIGELTTNASTRRSRLAAS